MDPLGFATQSVLDLLGRQTAWRNPLGFWSSSLYNTRGLVTQTTDTAGQNWTSDYGQ